MEAAGNQGGVEREDVSFASGAERCAAWLYRPAAPTPPVIVMAHGLGAERQMRLDAFAERFRAAGYACLVFDYRHFGASGGVPRRLLDIGRQLEDWAAAIAFARTIDGVDRDRVVLWGTSFGGGHVIAAGSRDGRVAAVISQCPFTDGPASVLATDRRSAAKAMILGLRDLAAAALARPPVYTDLVGPPGSAALMTAPDAEEGYRAIVPPGESFDNEVAARIALRIGLYRPGRQAGKLTCPALFILCEADSVAPSKVARRQVAKAPRGEVRLLPYGHFEIYRGEPFERNVAEQLAFLAARVPTTGGAESA